jgi:hypothetical protein
MNMMPTDLKTTNWLQTQRPQLEKVKDTLLRRTDGQSLLIKLNEILAFPMGVILNPYQESLVNAMKAEMTQYLSARKNSSQASQHTQNSYISSSTSSSSSISNVVPDNIASININVPKKPTFSIISFHQDVLKLHKCCSDLSNDRNTYIIKLISSNIGRIKG